MIMTTKRHGQGSSPEGNKNIRPQLLFDVKHDGRDENMLEAHWHLNDISLSSI